MVRDAHCCDCAVLNCHPPVGFKNRDFSHTLFTEEFFSGSGIKEHPASRNEVCRAKFATVDIKTVHLACKQTRAKSEKSGRKLISKRKAEEIGARRVRRGAKDFSV